MNFDEIKKDYFCNLHTLRLVTFSILLDYEKHHKS